MNIRDDNRWGPLSLNTVDAFERRHGISLPSDYREFLLSHHGGVPDPNFYWVVLKDWGSGIENLYGFGKAGYTLEEYHTGKSQIGVSEDLLVIGDDGCCNYLCIGVEGAKQGKVFYIDCEFSADDPRKCRELTASFKDFLSSLSRSPDEERRDSVRGAGHDA